MADKQRCSLTEVDEILISVLRSLRGEAIKALACDMSTESYLWNVYAGRITDGLAAQGIRLVRDDG